MKYLGDFRAGKTVRFTFSSVNGAPITLAGSPAVSVYKDGSTAQSTSGVTLTVDYDSVTGLNHVAIDTSSDATFYGAGSDFSAVITAGTVGGTSVVGYTVAHFSIENRSALMPTTDGRKLDVSAGGEAGLDWANIGSPTTTVNLSGTTVKNVTDIGTLIGVAGAGLTAIGDARLANLDALISSRAAASTALSNLTWSDARAAKIDNLDTTVSSRNATAPPTAIAIRQEIDSNSTALAAIAGYLDTEVAAIKAKTDLIPAAPAAVGDIPTASAIANQVDTVLTASHPGDWAATGEGGGGGDASFTADDRTMLAAVATDTARLAGTLEADGDGYRFTSGALANSPSGTGAFTDADREQLDSIESKIVGTTITVQSPVNESGDSIRIMRSRDYAATEGRSIDLASESWPTLDGTVQFIVADKLTIDAEITADRAVRVQITPADTAGIDPKTYSWELVATQANDHVISLMTGDLVLTRGL
ncbi:MAG: hypothetical protein V4710_19020 [Verrucomicrobiota bacterium]